MTKKRLTICIDYIVNHDRLAEAGVTEEALCDIITHAAKGAFGSAYLTIHNIDWSSDEIKDDESIVDTAMEEGCRLERAFGDRADAID